MNGAAVPEIKFFNMDWSQCRRGCQKGPRRLASRHGRRSGPPSLYGPYEGLRSRPATAILEAGRRPWPWCRSARAPMPPTRW